MREVSDNLAKARARHTHALLNARTRNQPGDLGELSAAARALTKAENEELALDSLVARRKRHPAIDAHGNYRAP